MTRLAVPDAGWLLIEGRERPMHVGVQRPIDHLEDGLAELDRAAGG